MYNFGDNPLIRKPKRTHLKLFIVLDCSQPEAKRRGKVITGADTPAFDERRRTEVRQTRTGTC